MSALFYRDLRILFRNPKSWLVSVIFFILFLALFAIALRGDTDALHSNAPVLIWLGLVFSLANSFETIFDRDIKNQQFEQLLLAGISPFQIALSKFLSGFLAFILPLVLAIPLAGLFYSLPSTLVFAIMISVLIGGPALVSYSIAAAAILAGHQGKGFLICLISLPILVPVIIFALAGIEVYKNEGLFNLPFQALFGMNLIAIAVSLPAAAAALNVTLD